MRQTVMVFRTWGGRRRGAGRRRVGPRARVVHVRRAHLPRRFPVHVTWRADGVGSLRRGRTFAAVRRAMYAGAARRGFRLVHYAVLGDHVHLIVEAADRKSLWRGMQGLGVRIAKRINRTLGRAGRVLSDRYHAHILTTLSEVRRAREYLRTNAARHYGHRGEDPCAPRAPLLWPHTWLLARAQRDAPAPNVPAAPS